MKLIFNGEKRLKCEKEKNERRVENAFVHYLQILNCMDSNTQITAENGESSGSEREKGWKLFSLREK